jgi:hypothetical protein
MATRRTTTEAEQYLTLGSDGGGRLYQGSSRSTACRLARRWSSTRGSLASVYRLIPGHSAGDPIAQFTAHRVVRRWQVYEKNSGQVVLAGLSSAEEAEERLQSLDREAYTVAGYDMVICAECEGPVEGGQLHVCASYQTEAPTRLCDRGDQQRASTIYTYSGSGAPFQVCLCTAHATEEDAYPSANLIERQACSAAPEPLEGYAWVITRDAAAEEFGDQESAVGVSGPEGATDSQVERARSAGRRFRMRTADGRVVGEGRVAGSIGFNGDPLADFGATYWGGVAYEEQDGASWRPVVGSVVEAAPRVVRQAAVADTRQVVSDLVAAEYAGELGARCQYCSKAIIPDDDGWHHLSAEHATRCNRVPEPRI